MKARWPEPTGATDWDRAEMAKVLASVASCPDRGPVLPWPEQPPCGCSELTRCNAGKGETSGSVTLADCMKCRREHLIALSP